MRVHIWAIVGVGGGLMGPYSRRRAVRFGRMSVETMDVVLAYASARARGAM